MLTRKTTRHGIDVIDLRDFMRGKDNELPDEFEMSFVGTTMSVGEETKPGQVGVWIEFTESHEG